MKIFMTGVGGYIGTAVAARLRADGHEVAGLTRDFKKAERLSRQGVEAVIGDMNAPASWRGIADGCEALIHLGFERGSGTAEADRSAVGALLASAKAARAPRIFIYTSGVWVLGPASGSPAGENWTLNPPAPVRWRPLMEEETLAAAGGGVSTAVIRPGCVYGGTGGLYGAMIQSIMNERKVRIPGDGRNRWAAVYLEDLAELYALVLRHRPSRVIYHATDGSGDALRDVAAAFADAAGEADVVTMPLERARRAMGPMADLLAMDQSVSSAKAQRELGWMPRLSSPVKHAAALLEQWEARSPASGRSS